MNVDSLLVPAVPVRPVLGWFRSISVFPISAADGHLLDPGLLCDWIARFDRWYTVAIGQRLELLYARELLVGDCVPMANAEYLARVALTCRLCGMDVALTVNLDDESDPKFDRLFEIMSDGALSTLVVMVPAVRTVTEWTEDRCERWRHRLERVLAAGVVIELVSDIVSLRALGVLRMTAVNRSSLTIYPKDSAWTSRGSERSLASVTGCFARFRLFVDAEGWIYPCMAFLVEKTGTLGHVGDPIDKSALGRGCAFDLDRLARFGPEHAQADAVPRSEEVPLVCERHLAFLRGVARPKARNRTVERQSGWLDPG